MARGYWLTPPTYPIFLISLVLVILVLLETYTPFHIPFIAEYRFETLLVAYFVLLAGNIFRGV
ncbi:MAG: hypothetical protein ACPW61_09235 [Methyloligella sp. ZOD6]